MKKTLVALAALGGLTLAGCDSPGDVELVRTEYTGKVTMRFVQEVRLGDDAYRLEIRDSLGNLLGQLRTVDNLDNNIINLSPERTYDLNDKGVRLSRR